NMRKPNLVNPQNWTPFKPMPVADQTIEMVIPKEIPVEVPVFKTRPLTKREMIQRNSFFLNVFGLIIIICVSYFLYSIYLERKLLSNYLNYVQNNQQEQWLSF